jgi:hypothetical protein
MPCRITLQGERMIRVAREEEQQRRGEARERRRDEDRRESQRIAAIEREWASFKSGVAQWLFLDWPRRREVSRCHPAALTAQQNERLMQLP